VARLVDAHREVVLELDHEPHRLDRVRGAAAIHLRESRAPAVQQRQVGARHTEQARDHRERQRLRVLRPHLATTSVGEVVDERVAELGQLGHERVGAARCERLAREAAQPRVLARVARAERRHERDRLLGELGLQLVAVGGRRARERPGIFERAAHERVARDQQHPAVWVAVHGRHLRAIYPGRGET
jgi:hypothetical protein